MQLDTAISHYLKTLEHERNLSHRTITAYRFDLQQFSREVPDHDVMNITTVNIRDYIEKLSSGKVEETTIKRKIASLKAFFNFLETEEFIAVTPTRKIHKRYKTARKLPRVLSPSEIGRLLRAPLLLEKRIGNKKRREENGVIPCNRSKQCIRDKAILEILFSTGIRIGELSALNIDCFDQTSHTVRIMGKGGKERVLFLSSDEVIVSLRRYLEIREPNGSCEKAIFLNRYGGRLSIYSVENIFKKYKKLARIKGNHTPHALRHTMATMLLENGADIRAVQERLVPTAALKTASSEMAGDCDGASVRDRQKSLSVAENAKGAIKANIEHHVLNALRYQRFGSELCRRTKQFCRDNGAQRLTASEGWISPCKLYYIRDTWELCSTPYGIRGLDQPTWGRERRYISILVLNALRHQRVGSGWIATSVLALNRVLNALRHQRVGSESKSTPAVFSTSSSAQRLTASEGWIRRFFELSIRTTIACAQRLTASEGWIRERHGTIMSGMTVLNVLRHQRVGSEHL